MIMAKPLYTYIQILNRHMAHIASKAILVAGRGGLQDSEMLRIPHFLDNRLTDGSGVVSLTRQQRFIPKEDS
jgi:hypothetical protein